MILGEEPIRDAIRQWRINQGLNISDASRAAGIHTGVWSRVESGKTANPLYETVMKMWAALGAQVTVAAAPRERQPEPLQPQLPMTQTPLPWQQQTPPVQPKKPRNRLHADG